VPLKFSLLLHEQKKSCQPSDISSTQPIPLAIFSPLKRKLIRRERGSNDARRFSSCPPGLSYLLEISNAENGLSVLDTAKLLTRVMKRLLINYLFE
jgi:hypothetical protein